MDKDQGFEMEGDRGLFRPAGSISLEEGIAQVRAAIAAARSHEAVDLLVDATRWTGFPCPDTLERFLAGVEWAEEARGSLRLSLVLRADYIDRDKFAVIVAANRGLVSNVFPTEAEARAWLDAMRKTARRGPTPG